MFRIFKKKSNTSDIPNMGNHELGKLNNMIIGSTGMSVKMNLKLNILHNAINGNNFMVIDETGELKEMIKHSELKVITEELENGNAKYIFNHPEQL